MDAKTLVFDIETFPIVAYVWGLKDQNIGLNQIKDDSSIAAWGAKWLGEAPVMYQDRRNMSERSLLKGIWKLLDEADVVITQNGKSFDSKRLNARFIHYGMKPPKPYRHIDTYLLAKHAADFTSNKLEYLTKTLCKKYQKTSHPKYPGMELWKGCLNGDKAAWDEMKGYNIGDVLSTEELYERLKPYGPKNMPRLYLSPSRCKLCGSETQRRGYDKSGKTIVQRVRCKSLDCGKWDTELLPKKETK